MEIGTNYKKVCDFDVSGIIDEISSVPIEFWDIDTSRQGKGGPKSVHKHTKSLFVNVVPLTWNGDGYPFSKMNIFSEKLRKYTDDITSTLESMYNGKIGRTLYITLKSHSSIPVHKDYGYYLRNSHRFHVPIITNDNVIFYLDGETINMKTGSCYEINNARDHAVVNKSDFNRIHLVFDIIPMESFKS